MKLNLGFSKNKQTSSFTYTFHYHHVTIMQLSPTKMKIILYL